MIQVLNQLYFLNEVKKKKINLTSKVTAWRTGKTHLKGEHWNEWSGQTCSDCKSRLFADIKDKIISNYMKGTIILVK